MKAPLLAFALALSVQAQAALPPAVKAALDRAGIPVSAVGIVVQQVDAPRAAVSQNPATPMNPASVMKLVTAYAALDLLGPAYTFRTDVLATGPIDSGVLQGDLVLRGGGDPRLLATDLWQLVHQLRSRGIHEVTGDVILDRTHFAPAPHDPGRFDNDPHRAYNVGADALLANQQVVTFRFVPDGNGVRVIADPDLPNVEVQSRLVPTAEPCGSWRRGIRHAFDERGLLATVSFTGEYPTACGEREWALSLFDAPRFLEANLRWLWSEAGVKLRGKVRSALAPGAARLVLRHESPPLADLVRDMDKHSNNVMARHLFLELSAAAGTPGDEARSAGRVREWLATRHIDAQGLVLENGSGLSRSERVSAQTLAALLRDAWHGALMPELVSSLPILGVDGTFRSRTGTTATGQAHLKGGTLDDVQAIAGFVVDRGGARWIVVMLVNHPRAGAAQPAVDALVDWAHAHGPKAGAP